MCRNPYAADLVTSLGLLATLVWATCATASIVPADRQTLWNPGIPGGVPHRTTICATVSASTYGNGAQDATVGIQAAVNACPTGQVVQLSAGEFKITATLLITKGVVLRGKGPALTKLKMPVGTNANLITIGTRWFKMTQAIDLAGDARKGSRRPVRPYLDVRLTDSPIGPLYLERSRVAVYRYTGPVR